MWQEQEPYLYATCHILWFTGFKPSKPSFPADSAILGIEPGTSHSAHLFSLAFLVLPYLPDLLRKAGQEKDDTVGILVPWRFLFPYLHSNTLIIPLFL